MFAWIRLMNGVWWPGCIADTEKTDDSSSLYVHMPHLKMMKLNGKATIPIDISQTDSVDVCRTTEMSGITEFLHLHQDQVLPEDQSAVFSLAVEELAVQLGLKTVTVTEKKETKTKTYTETEKVMETVAHTAQQLVKTSKRTSAISWDNYFMAVAFLSA
jgi:hypothetical protein